MKKTSVLAILAAAAFATSPLYAQDTSSQPSSEPSSAVSSEPSSQPSSEPSSQASSEPSSAPSSAASSEPSSDAGNDDGDDAGFSLDFDVSFSFSFTLPQAIEFRDVIIETGTAPTEVDSGVDISVGATVPSTITLTPLPATLIALYPELEGYLFFILPDGRIIVVHPQTLKIVLILIVD
jgi:hypothetical protein